MGKRRLYTALVVKTAQVLEKNEPAQCPHGGDTDGRVQRPMNRDTNVEEVSKMASTRFERNVTRQQLSALRPIPLHNQRHQRIERKCHPAWR